MKGITLKRIIAATVSLLLIAIFIVLNIGIFPIPAIIPSLLFDHAQNTNNSFYCRLIFGEPYIGFLWDSKRIDNNACARDIAYRNENKSDCNVMRDLKWRFNCILYLSHGDLRAEDLQSVPCDSLLNITERVRCKTAKSEKLPLNLCEGALKHQGSSDYDYCVFALALQEKNISLCDTIPAIYAGSELDPQTQCYQRYAEESGNIQNCFNFLQKYKIDFEACTRKYAKESLNETTCDALASTERDMCLNLIAKNTKRPEVCEKILTPDESFNCVTYLKTKLNDTSICDRMNKSISNYESMVTHCKEGSFVFYSRY